MITLGQFNDFGWVSHCIEVARRILAATQPYAAGGDI